MSYLCEECGELFYTALTLERHVKSIHKLTFKCDVCKFETEDKQASMKTGSRDLSWICNMKIKNIKLRFTFENDVAKFSISDL